MSTQQQVKKEWDWEIGSRTGWWTGFDFAEIWRYRSLLLRWIRRDLILHYQQTLLGPVWVLLQPILILVTYLLVFGKLIGIPTGGIPPVLFYLTGIVLWNFFSESMLSTSLTFSTNASLFSKVYFPRIIVPVANVISNLIRFLIQFALLLVLLIYYWLIGKYDPSHANAWLLFVPVALVLIALFGLGLGLFFSVLTGKYRDLSHVVSLGIRLMMFVTPIIYPVKMVPEKIRWIVELNPMTSLVEVFRYGIFGEGVFNIAGLLYSAVFILFLVVGSTMLFNKQADKIMDVV